MKIYYDLHIHSSLSPCGDEDMTPNNIVNMSVLKGLDIISVTDHNNTNNLQAVFKVAKKTGLMFLPGIEVNTKEEVHALCYFRELDPALEFGKIIYESLPRVKNKPGIFGEQLIYDSEDNIVGEVEKLLINSSKYSLNELFFIIKEYKGVLIPAHINKKTNSILSVLGFIPPNLKIDVIEVNDKNYNIKMYEKYKIINNSDAHQLIDISERINYLELNNIDEIYDFLCLSY